MTDLEGRVSDLGRRVSDVDRKSSDLGRRVSNVVTHGFTRFADFILADTAIDSSIDSNTFL